MKIAFHPSAITDIRLSQNWYEQENKALGNRFSKSEITILAVAHTHRDPLFLSETVKFRLGEK